MVEQENGRVYECVVVDLNTQYDFCAYNGAFPVANLNKLRRALRRMVAWTKRNGVPIISSIASHRASELSDNGHGRYCIDGSEGQKKVDFTLFPRCTRVELDSTLTVPLDVFHRCQQIIFRKRTEDLLGNPKADRFFTHLPVREFLLYGNTLEGSIKALALGLLARQKRVLIVTDCCGYWNAAAADLAIGQMLAKGAALTTLDELKQRKLQNRLRYPGRNGTRRSPGSNGRANQNGNRRGNPAERETDVRGNVVQGNGRRDDNGSSGESLHSHGPADRLSTRRTNDSISRPDGLGLDD